MDRWCREVRNGSIVFGCPGRLRSRKGTLAFTHRSSVGQRRSLADTQDAGSLAGWWARHVAFSYLSGAVQVGTPPSFFARIQICTVLRNSIWGQAIRDDFPEAGVEKRKAQSGFWCDDRTRAVSY